MWPILLVVSPCSSQLLRLVYMLFCMSFLMSFILHVILNVILNVRSYYDRSPFLPTYTGMSAGHSMSNFSDDCPNLPVQWLFLWTSSQHSWSITSFWPLHKGYICQWKKRVIIHNKKKMKTAHNIIENNEWQGEIEEGESHSRCHQQERGTTASAAQQRSQ